MDEDRTLVAKVLGGDLQAFRMLIKQHERLVAGMIGRLVKLREEREELCQDVFLKVYEKLGNFNFKSKLSTWIATIAYRMALNHLKKRKFLYRDIPEDDDISDYFIEKTNPELIAEKEDMDRMILEIVEQLPLPYRTVLMMFHSDGLSYPEITEITGMPEGTVKSYIFRARNLLKDRVLKYLGKEELS